MTIIKKPKPPKYETLAKKVKLTEDTYLTMLEYIDWNPSLNKDDFDFLIEESLKHVFETDKSFKKHLKSEKNLKKITG